MIQLSAWKRWLLRHNYCSFILSLCLASSLVAWVLLCGICLSLRQDCSGLQKANKSPHNSQLPLAMLGAMAWGCFLQHLTLFLSLCLHVTCMNSPPSNSLMSKSLISACVQVGCYLLGCRCSAPYSFKGKDQGRFLILPCF